MNSTLKQKKMNHSLRKTTLAIILFLALLAFGYRNISAHTQVDTAPQWQEVELVFEAEQEYNNPYTDVEMAVEFSGPDGREIRRPAFWDGDSTWRVRFASPAAAGEWNWRSVSS